MSEILIVDDDEALRRWEERVVRDQGYSCDSASDAKGGREHLQQHTYKLALLDVNMPGESGIELLSHIRREHPAVAVVMVTGEDSTELAMTAIEQGAYGYLVKPLGSGELLINIANALHRRRSELENRQLVERLQGAVQERSNKLEDALQDLELSETKVWVSQAETIFRLARIVEFRDEETGHHLHRMSSYCEILARQIGRSAQHCELVRLASQLHDVGKVAVPDSVLLKPGKLTPEEFEVIKSHAETGHKMLAGSTRRSCSWARRSPSPTTSAGMETAIPVGCTARRSRRRDGSRRWPTCSMPSPAIGSIVPRCPSSRRSR